MARLAAGPSRPWSGASDRGGAAIRRRGHTVPGDPGAGPTPGNCRGHRRSDCGHPQPVRRHPALWSDWRLVRVGHGPARPNAVGPRSGGEWSRPPAELAAGRRRVRAEVQIGISWDLVRRARAAGGHVAMRGHALVSGAPESVAHVPTEMIHHIRLPASRGPYSGDSDWGGESSHRPECRGPCRSDSDR